MESAGLHKDQIACEPPSHVVPSAERSALAVFDLDFHLAISEKSKGESPKNETQISELHQQKDHPQLLFDAEKMFSSMSLSDEEAQINLIHLPKSGTSHCRNFAKGFCSFLPEHCQYNHFSSHSRLCGNPSHRRSRRWDASCKFSHSVNSVLWSFASEYNRHHFQHNNGTTRVPLLWRNLYFFPCWSCVRHKTHPLIEQADKKENSSSEKIILEPELIQEPSSNPLKSSLIDGKESMPASSVNPVNPVNLAPPPTPSSLQAEWDKESHQRVESSSVLVAPTHHRFLSIVCKSGRYCLLVACVKCRNFDIIDEANWLIPIRAKPRRRQRLTQTYTDKQRHASHYHHSHPYTRVQKVQIERTLDKVEMAPDSKEKQKV